MKPLARLIVLCAAFAVKPACVLADSQGAAGSEGGTLPPSSFILQAVALLILLACVLAAAKFYSSVKGGRVARGWMWVLCGFLVFAGAQVLLFGGQLGFLPLLVTIVDAMRVVSLLLFFVGINQLRKVVA